MRSVNIILCIVCGYLSCKESPAPNTKHLQVRDTTITPSNAYTNLFLDSLLVSNFFSNETNNLKNQIIDFYNARNYEFAWFTNNEITLQAQGFWDVHNNYLVAAGDSSIFDHELHNIMDTLLYSGSEVTFTKEKLVQTELLLTRHFFLYAKLAYGSKADPQELQWHIPKRKLSITALLDSLLSLKEKNWQPLNSHFHLLQKAIIRYRQIEQAGGWELLDLPARKLKKGDSNVFITSFKQRIATEGFFNSADTSAIFNESLFRSVQVIRSLYGLPYKGLIDQLLLSQLNVPITDRIKQMLINLERMKWMPPQPNDFITINIPEYKFRLIADKKEAIAMNVVVGKAANRTVIFSDELEYIVFSPYWNIPPSIVRNEIVPSIRNNGAYLHQHNMEITGYSNGLPVVRQKPGNANALGRVKFLFPNNYNIYFHDTPAKSLFKRNRRDFSHGCIRLEYPFGLAKYLLQSYSNWTELDINKAMHSDKEKWVILKQKWPVFITYFTSWADEEGRVHFLSDIYGHDERLANQLFN